MSVKNTSGLIPRFVLYSERHEDGCVRWRLLTKGLAPARRAA